jgi:hypothetical protein
MEKLETDAADLNALPEIGSIKPIKVKKKRVRKKKKKKRKVTVTDTIVEVEADPVDETPPDHLALIRGKTDPDKEALDWLHAGAVGELSPEALEKLQVTLRSNRNRLEVFRHLIAQRKIGRASKLSEFMDKIDDRLFTEERVAGASTVELAGLRKIAKDQVDTDLDFIGDVSKETQAKIPDDALPAKDSEGSDLEDIKNMPSVRRDAIRALFSDIAEVLMKGAKQNDD